MRINFELSKWLRDKSQKVETRDGRIVHNIWGIKEPFYTNNKKAEVCALIDGEEDALVFFEGGRYLPTTKDTDNPFDLFIVTPEPELTDWETLKAAEKVLKDNPYPKYLGDGLYRVANNCIVGERMMKVINERLKAELIREEEK